MTRPRSFSQWLRAHRRALGLTQAELGARAACSAAAIRKFEAGQRRPSRAVAERLAAALALPAHEQLAFVEQARAREEVSPGAARLPALPDSPFVGRARERRGWLHEGECVFRATVAALEAMQRQEMADAVLGRALTGLGVFAVRLDGPSVAIEHLRRGLAHLHADHDLSAAAYASYRLSLAHMRAGAYAEALAAQEESAALYTRLSERWGKGVALA